MRLRQARGCRGLGRGKLRRFFDYLFSLYRGIIKWAESRSSLPVLSLVAFAEASFFPVPPEVIMFPLCLNRPKSSLKYSLITTISSVSGAVLGYIIGFYFMDIVGEKIIGFFNLSSHFSQVKSLYYTYGHTIVFIAAFTPIPYKVFTIASGALQLNIFVFLLASLAGRGARYFLIGFLFYFFGERAREFIEKHFNNFVIIITVLIIAGLLLYFYFF